MRRQTLLWTLSALYLLAGAGARAGSWTNLWLTPDQQGQRLLDAGHPAQAAHRFEDPRRRAYADLKAGRYASAAKLLAPFKDPESEYNRGNALARTGRLRAALNAYDAALKNKPADPDIRHNRDLVAKALRKQQKKRAKQATGRQHRNKSQASQGSKPQGSERQAKRSRGRDRQHEEGGGNSGGKAARAGSKQNRREPGTGSRPNEAAQSKTQHPAGQPPDAARSRHAKRTGPQRQVAESKEQQAKRDAAAAARLRRRRATAGADERSAASGTAGASRGHRSKPPKPPTERALSLDQWLRRIPDNPAGLLRRKFLIENALRAQQSKQQ